MKQQASNAIAKTKSIDQGRTPGTTKGKTRRAKELKNKARNVAETATPLGVSEHTLFRYLEMEAARPADNDE